MRLLLALIFAASLVAPAWAEPPSLVPASERADFVLIEKAERRLTLWRDGAMLKSYAIGLGGLLLVLVWGWHTMRRAEKRRDEVKRR